MTKRICSIAGCGEPHYGKGWCCRHYRLLREAPECEIEKCGDPVIARGWCSKHYQRWKHHGTPSWEPVIPTDGCSVEGCAEAHKSLGFCRKHYWRWTEHGDPLHVKAPAASVAFVAEAVARAMAGEQGCILWDAGKLNQYGYGRVKVKRKERLAHRAALVLFSGEDPPDLLATHGECHTRSCVNPNHLSWQTPKANTADKMRDGTWQTGMTHPSRKLDEDKVRAIRSSGEDGDVLAQRYGVCKSTISHVRSRRTWKHI